MSLRDSCWKNLEIEGNNNNKWIVSWLYKDIIKEDLLKIQVL